MIKRPAVRERGTGAAPLGCGAAEGRRLGAMPDGRVAIDG